MFDNFGYFGGSYNNSDNNIFQFFPVHNKTPEIKNNPKPKMHFFKNDYCDCIKCQACNIIYKCALEVGEI